MKRSILRKQTLAVLSNSFLAFSSLFLKCLLISSLMGLSMTPAKADPGTNPPPAESRQDSIPEVDYVGYRLYLTHFAMVKQKKDWIMVSLSAINTGANNMYLGQGAEQIVPVIVFDPSFEQSELKSMKTQLFNRLMEQKVTVPAGAISTNIQFKMWPKSPSKPPVVEPVEAGELETAPRDMITELFEVEVEEGGKKTEEIEEHSTTAVLTAMVEEGNELVMMEAPQQVTQVEPQIETPEPVIDDPAVDQVVETVDMPDSEIEPTVSPSKASTVSPEALVAEEPELSTVPVESMPTAIEGTEDLASPREISSSETPEQPVKDEVMSDALDLALESTTETDEACSDLVLENLEIVKKNRNSLTLAYTVSNQGLGPADLVMGKKSDQKGIAIRANLSTSEKLTRGSIVLGGTFLHGEEVRLMGGETYQGTIKIDISRMTKFTPVVILELDAYQFVMECDETNNRGSIRVLEETED